MARRSQTHTVRLSEEEQVTAATGGEGAQVIRTQRLSSRAAIRNEVAGREIEVTSAEQRMAATMEKVCRGTSFARNRGQQALFAVLDTLVKGPSSHVSRSHPAMLWVRPLLQARDRYARFVKSAGQAMVGDSQTALHDLVNRAE